MGKMILRNFFETNKIDWQCPVCMSREYETLEKHRSSAKMFEGTKTKLITCSTCSAKSVYPMPSEQDICELNKSFWEYQSDTRSARRRYYAQALYRVEYLRNYLNNLKDMEILDIGSGHAYIYDVLDPETNDLDYSVVEADTNMRNELRRKGIERVYEEVGATKHLKFDLIILSHILEHLREPKRYLEEVKHVLKENGYMFVEVPNQDDLHKQDLGAHLVVFNPNSLRKLFEELHFSVVNMVTVGSDIGDLIERKSMVKIRDMTKNLRASIKSHVPQIARLIKLMKGRYLRQSRNKNEPMDLSYYKFNVYSNNGRWLRAIVQKGIKPRNHQEM